MEDARASRKIAGWTKTTAGRSLVNCTELSRVVVAAAHDRAMRIEQVLAGANARDVVKR